MLSSLTSCDDDPYFSPLVGTWEANYTDLGPIHPFDVDYFTFFADGTGTYEYYDDYGYLCQMYFVWRTRNDEWLYITYEDGYSTTCYFRFYRGYLEFSDDITFSAYTGNSMWWSIRPRR